MNEQEAIQRLKDFGYAFQMLDLEEGVIYLSIKALEKQVPKKVYHFLDTDTFETTCCGIDVMSKDYTYCPCCGQLLGEVEEVEE